MSVNVKKLLDEEPVLAAGAANLLVMAGVLTTEQANLAVKVTAAAVAVAVQVASFVVARKKSVALKKVVAAAVDYVGRHETPAAAAPGVPVATPQGDPQSDVKAAP